MTETAQQADGSEEAKTKAASLKDQGCGIQEQPSAPLTNILTQDTSFSQWTFVQSCFLLYRKQNNGSAEQIKVIDELISYHWNDL